MLQKASRNPITKERCNHMHGEGAMGVGMGVGRLLKLTRSTDLAGGSLRTSCNTDSTRRKVKALLQLKENQTLRELFEHPDLHYPRQPTVTPKWLELVDKPVWQVLISW